MRVEARGVEKKKKQFVCDSCGNIESRSRSSRNSLEKRTINWTEEGKEGVEGYPLAHTKDERARVRE